jgi:hypothetical protein
MVKSLDTDMKDFLIVDDFIPLEYQERIKQLLFDKSSGFTWFYKKDVNVGNEYSPELGPPKPALNHSFRISGETKSSFYNIVEPMAELATEVFGYKLTSVLNCRTFLQFPLNEKFSKHSIDHLHIDIDQPHLVLLYYNIDSDGDTLFVNKKRQPGEPREYAISVDDYEIINRVTPKQGRAVLFDGWKYHTAEQPQHNIRSILNFDII